jgi:hypothetical protein
MTGHAHGATRSSLLRRTGYALIVLGVAVSGCGRDGLPRATSTASASPDRTTGPSETSTIGSGWGGTGGSWELTIDLDTFNRAGHGDNWPTTWGSDDELYTAFADGMGFNEGEPLSFGLARVSGDSGLPGAWSGTDLPGAGDLPVGWGCSGRKASSLLDIGGTLYAAMRNTGDNCTGTRSILRRSGDGGRTWEWASWEFADFGYPSFLQLGAGYTDGGDGYVYLYSPTNASAYEVANALWLARAPSGDVFDEDAWQYLSDAGHAGAPRWSARSSDKVPVFELPGRVYRPSLVYDAGIGRILLTTMVNRGVADVDALHVYGAPAPWGPWEAIYENEEFSELWPDDRSASPFHAQFPAKWISQDGTELFLVFSCCPDTPGYAFNVVRARLTPR